MTRGLSRLRRAESAAGTYLPQAVIAAAHATAPTWNDTDWALICKAYDRVVDLTGSPVAQANRALAIGFRDGYRAGLHALDEVSGDPRLARSSSTAAIRADLLRRSGRFTEAAEAYRAALRLNGSEPARAFLARRLVECGG
jgi:RNA polymerase sigma-70 factor (ECF subfamily)